MWQVAAQGLRRGRGRLALWWDGVRRRRRLCAPDLRQLNDRALADMGLRRADVEPDPCNPFWRP